MGGGSGRGGVGLGGGGAQGGVDVNKELKVL